MEEECKGKRKEEVETFKCLICFEFTPMDEIFQSKIRCTNNDSACLHRFCIDCISKYIDAKLQDNITTIKCPDVDCNKAIEFDSCINIIPKSVLDRWEDVLSKSMILSKTKLYCPFKKCSVPILIEDEVTKPKIKCPNCKQKVCIRCKVAWHYGMKCKEFNESEDDITNDTKEDVMFRELAKRQLWSRCPKCKFYIERIDGCEHIHCWCGCEFCYDCGSKHGNCVCSDDDEYTTDGDDDSSASDCDDDSSNDDDGDS